MASRGTCGWARRGIAVAVVLALGAGAAEAVVSGGTGVIGPVNQIQPTGRQLHPTGKLVELGNFPTGGALTPDGRFLWTLSTGYGRNDIRIVKVGLNRGHGTSRIVQNFLMPGLDGGSRSPPAAGRHTSRDSLSPPTKTFRFPPTSPAAAAM